MRTYDPVAIARLFLFVREVPENKGRRVEAIQRWTSGEVAPEPWCDDFVWLVYDICYQGESPLPRTASTQETLAFARTQGWVTPVPTPGCLVFSVNDQGVPHHVAICTATGPLKTIAGNTSADGLSSNGDRVAEHEVNPAKKVFVRVP